MSFLRALLIATFAFVSIVLNSTATAQEPQVNPELFQAMQYRSIGPYRGGRVTTVSGVWDDDRTYYMGATGGGVWKTTDAGITWQNVSDGFYNTTGIGAITVAKSDVNIVYVGTGESPVRGVKTSHGDGVYKSTDAGKTWTHMGLKESRHISRIYVHPKNPDLVYVAAQGNPWGPNDERGMYRSKDGGETWEKILFVNEDSGIVDLTVSEENPRIMMATSWEFNRKPWVVVSGGPGSRVYITTDGGDTWVEINEGLPELKGKMGIAMAASDHNIVYLAIDALDGKGGVYRSTDGGESFSQVSDDGRTHARAWYYLHIYVDPNDANEVYVLNGGLMKSIDGGKTYDTIRAPHVDHHALWFNPNDSTNFINGNDGGANITFNGGKTWSSIMNQPTGQFYRVITDNLFPYNVYGSQQDDNAITIKNETLSGGIGERHWFSLGSGESSTIAFDPENPRFVYSTYFASMIGEWDRDTGNYRDIRPYPERVTGEQPKNLKLRANWNSPVIVSPHDPSVIYYGSQYLMKSTDRGASWDIISEDLTRNDKEHQGLGGIPISNEQITAESYNNLFVIAESPLEQGVIWTGSDDGLIHITRDNGETYENVTPRGMSEAIVNVIDASPHQAGKAYFAVAGYKLNDFTPVIYKTEDYGQSFTKIVNGLPEDTFVRSVREDPKREGLLYAGTETGMFVSFDDGENWQEFQLNLPEVPITDLHIRHDDLVVATQGRSFWLLDNLTPLHQIYDGEVGDSNFLYKPESPLRSISLGYPEYSGQDADVLIGRNPPKGLQVQYVHSEELGEDDTISMEVFNANGDLVHSEYSNDTRPQCALSPRAKNLKKAKGANRWTWNMMIGEYECFEEVFKVTRGINVYKAVPGQYSVKLTVGDFNQTQAFEIRIDPRLTGTHAENLKQYQDMDALNKSLYKIIQEMSKGVIDLRNAQKQIETVRELSMSDDVTVKANALDQSLTSWVNKILQPNFQTFQHLYQMEAKHLMEVKGLIGRMASSDVPVSKGAREVAQRYIDEWNVLAAELSALKNNDIASFNTEMKSAGLPEIFLK
ncbi:MAG: glycosyl hydrolase [Kordiimonadaceae bacterium]|nr:glycosyl hydrolase [Kordiimonadaceae bacterium]